MIQTKIADTSYSIRSSWNDITFLGYCDIIMCHEEPIMNRLSVYTGIELDVLNKLTYSGIKQLMDYVEFMDSPDDVMGFAYAYESDINIGHEWYGKLENSKQSIAKSKIPLLGAVEVIKQYTDVDISNLPITKTIGQAVFFLTALLNSWKGSNDLPNMRQTVTNWKQVVSDLQCLAHGERQPLMPVEQT